MCIKKIICIILASIFVLSLCACGENKKDESDKSIEGSSIDIIGEPIDENETPEIVEPSLEDISFADLQGMDKWVRIVAYSAGDYVDIDFQDGGQKRDIIFKSAYFSFCRLRANETIMANSYTYRLLGDDEMVYNYHGDEVMWLIDEKVVLDEEKKQVVLKTTRGGYGYWFVPYDTIDWDRGYTRIKKDDYGYNTVDRYNLK